MANTTKAKLKSDSSGYALLSVPTYASDITHVFAPVTSVLGRPHFTKSEQSTGLTHTDGKTIYQKWVDLGTLPNNTSKNVAHGVSGYADFIFMIGFASYIGSNIWITLPNADPTDANNIYIYISGANIVVGTGSDRTGATGYLLLMYTKS